MTVHYWNKKSKTGSQRRFQLFSALLTVLFCASLIASGCNGGLRGRSKCCLFVNRTENAEITEKDVPVAHRPDLVLSIDDRIANITLSPDSKRMILETRLENENDESSKESTEIIASYGVEIWNIEFGVARPEAFTEASPYLVVSALGSAAFDEEGERVFWMDQETRKMVAQRTNALSTNAVVRGASSNENDPPSHSSTQPLYLARVPEETSFPELTSESAPLFLNEELESFDASPDDSSSFYVELQDYPEVNDSDNAPLKATEPVVGSNSRASKLWSTSYSFRDVENVLLTKPFEASSLIINSQAIGKNVDLSAKHMKIADETRYADTVRLSSNARWIICGASANVSSYKFIKLADNETTTPETEATGEAEEDKEIAATSEETAETDSEPYDPNWALIPLRDRKRVVRFPKTIKMTFDSSTSDEEILGQVVDVLDVSDQGDLVATLVEEIRPEGTDSRATSGGLNGSLRNKIVIWDIQVAKTVEFDKAKKPLRAIEVAQIAIPYSIERRFCKFSPSGKTFAARVEPKCVSIWQTASGRLISQLGDHAGVVRSFAFAPGETKMIIGVGGSRALLELWEIRKETIYRTLEDDAYDAKSIDAVAFSHDERYVYYANDVGEIKRWNTRPIYETE